MRVIASIFASSTFARQNPQHMAGIMFIIIPAPVSILYSAVPVAPSILGTNACSLRTKDRDSISWSSHSILIIYSTYIHPPPRHVSWINENTFVLLILDQGSFGHALIFINDTVVRWDRSPRLFHQHCADNGERRSVTTVQGWIFSVQKLHRYPDLE